jgi:putative ABC transport system ATP-binding protein
MLIKLDNISKTYYLDGVEVPALKKIDFSIKESDFIAIKGPSGSGKSTLMNIIGLLDTPTTGDVYLKEKKVSQISDNDRAHLRNEVLGFIFQQFNLLQRMTALENITLPLIYSQKDVDNPSQIGINILKKVGLEDRKDHKPNQLSGGQQQRVAIARALINDPQIILADEPTGNLDTKTGNQIMQILIDLNKSGKTLIVITHEAEVANYAQRIVNIVDGEIVN